MKANPLHPNFGVAYSDEQVIDAILDLRNENNLILKWFFNRARDYALGYLRSRYPRLAAEEWDVIFANTNLKVVTRFRKGISLHADTSLTTYYTSVAKFATLDYARSRQEEQRYQEVEEHQAIMAPQVQEHMEKEERSREIRQWLVNVVGNDEQVEVLLLHARGFSYNDMLEKTGYKSEGACRNAFLKGKKKITEYLLKHPDDAKKLRELLES